MNPPTRRGLTFAELWACLAVALPVLGALLAPISTVDLAYHLRAGAMILDTGRLPSPDVFTFTAGGQPWLDQQWAAQVVLAAIFRVGGWALLAVGRAALVGLIAGLVLWGCRSAGAGLRVAAWLTLAGFGVGLVSLALRPQLFGMALFALTLAILAARRRHPRLVWAIPLVVLAWSNVHGSFFLAPAAVGVAWLEDLAARRPGSARLLAVAVLSAAATLVEPLGTRGLDVRGRIVREPDHPPAHHRMAGDLAALLRRGRLLRLDRRGRRPRRSSPPGGVRSGRASPGRPCSGWPASPRSGPMPSEGSPGGRSRRRSPPPASSPCSPRGVASAAVAPHGTTRPPAPSR